MASIYQRKGSQFWWVKWKNRDGQIKRNSLETYDKQIAKEYLKRYVKLEQRENPQADDLDSMIEQWQAYREIAGSGRQAMQNARYLREYLDYAKIDDHLKINKPSLQQWVVSLIRGGMTPKTARNKMVAVTSFCRFLVDSGSMASIPKIDTPKVRKLPPRFLTVKQSDQLEKDSLAVHPLLHLAIVIGLKTGMRLNEIRQIDCEDIHWKQNLIVIPKTKSNRPRSIPMHHDLLVALAPYRDQQGPIFKSPRTGTYYDKWWFGDKFRDVQSEVFTDKMGDRSVGRAFHLLRHTFASRLVQAGVDIYKVSQWLGHSSVTTTMIYAHLAPRHDDDINKA